MNEIGAGLSAGRYMLLILMGASAGPEQVLSGFDGHWTKMAAMSSCFLTRNLLLAEHQTFNFRSTCCCVAFDFA